MRVVRTTIIVLVAAGAPIAAVLPEPSGASGPAVLPTTAAPGEPTIPTPPAASPSFPPGVWTGTAVMTGVISGGSSDAFVPEPIIMNFEVEIGPDGAVVSGVWEWSGDVVSTTEGGFVGNFTMSGSGPLGGTASRLEFQGIINMTGTMTVNGHETSVNNDMPAAGGFAPSAVSCNVVSGNMASTGEAQAAGFSTTVTAPFSAKRIAAPGDAGTEGFDEVYVELVTTGNNLLAMGTPPAADVVAFVERVEAFFHEAYQSATCPDAPSNMQPGKQHHSALVDLVGQIIVVALADPSVYTVDGLHDLAIAAVRIGVIGNAAGDPELAAQVTQVLRDVIEGKLIEAEAAQNKGDCAIIVITATALGFSDLVGPAQGCAA